MIQQLELQNFQSHKKTTLNLHANVNAIVGESDTGKTAILRALNWLYYNRPSGVEFVSHWNQDDKGNPIEPTYVRADFTPDCFVRRVREKALNGYDLNGQMMEAVKTDVPETLLPIFNISEVNIQRQMDAPFLLSESSGEVARFFNRIIRLDLIDRVLSRAEQMRRALKKDVEAAEAEEIRLTESLKTFAWTDAAETLLKKAVNVETRLAENKKQYETLFEKSAVLHIDLMTIEKSKWIVEAENLVAEYVAVEKSLAGNKQKLNLLSAAKVNLENNKFTLKNSNWIPKAEKLLTQFVNDEWNLLLQRNLKTELEIAKQTYETNMETLATLPDIPKTETLVRELEAQIKTVTESQRRYAGLKSTWMQINKLEADALDAAAELERLANQLPDTCPTCGQEWNHEEACV